jgi:RHS repeat-associated protein
MATASADLGKLEAFVSAANGILNGGDSASLGLNQRISSLRANYDSFQERQQSQYQVTNYDLMGGGVGGGEVGLFATNLERDRLFVKAVKLAFEEASGLREGVVTVDQVAFDAAFATTVRDVAREAGIDPAELLLRRSPVTVDPAEVGVIPQTSGFVNDPICTATGHFLEVEDDFVWPERLGILRWRRMYSSRFIAEGPFGRGWASWAGVGLVPQDDGAVGYQGPEGQLAVFRPELSGLGFERVSGVAASLSALAGGNGVNGGRSGWELAWDWQSPHPGEVWRFGTNGLLREVSGPATGTARFTYEGVRLVAINHDSGRRLGLDWEGSRVVGVRSSCGRQARYFYNEAGDLVRTERMLGDRGYVVDAQGLIVEVVDADGVRLCRNTFDDEGRVLTQVSPFGRETRLAYHPGYRTVVSDTGDGPVAVYEHDYAGRLVGLMDHDGHRMQRVFDAEGRCVSVTGFDGATTRQTFESGGRSASFVGADGVAERWEYDDQHRVASHEVEGGATVGFDYDGDAVVSSRMTGPDGWELHLQVVDGLLRSLTDADGVTVSFDYDRDGNVVAVTNGLGAVTRIEPHVSGEPSRLITPDGAVFEFVRDDAGQLLEVRTPTGDDFGIEWTPAGRLAGLLEPNGARTAFESGSHGEVQRITDALGAVMELQRDELARLVGLSAPGGAKWGFEYTALGLLSMVTDPSGAVWSYGYDAEGRMVTGTDPLGHEVRQRYNPAGRLVELLDRSGNATRYSHDALGRVVSETDPEGAVTELEWDAWGRPTGVRLPDGDLLSYRYTPAGRVAGVQTAEGRGWANRYDPAGRLVAVSDAVGSTTRFEWDACDRLVAVVSPAGYVARYRYDACGRAVELERDGRVWHTAYDHAGRVVSSTDPLGSTTTYEYNLVGKLVAATDPLGNTVRLRYDERGNPTGLVDPFGGLVSTTYDAMRRPVVVTDQVGRVTRIERDAAGRVVRQHLPTGDVVESRRDPRGQPTDVRVNGRDVIVFDRDRTGRPLLIHEPARNRTLTFTWTSGGQLESLDADGAEMRWEYDRDGLVSARHHPGGRTTRYVWDRAGHLSTVVIDDRGEIDLERDRDGRLTSLRTPGFERRWDHDNDGLVVATHMSGPHDDQTVELVRDAAGRVVEARDEAGVTRYRYDAAHQLVAAARGTEAWVWDYDPAGRLAREEGPHGARTFSYDGAHQLMHIDGPEGRTSFTCDAAGRRTEEHHPSGTRRYTWDGLGRLAGIEANGRHRDLDVDALGRLAAVDDTRLSWDPTAAVPELLSIGDRQVIGVGGLTLGLAAGSSDDTSWLAGDGRGSTDRADGRDAWGRRPPTPESATGDDSASLGYLGELDIDGLVWLRNRVYDPETRQFLSPDPLPGIPGLPVAANPYHYANNSPVGFVDPLGLQGQPLSIEEYNDYRAQNYGMNWNNIVTAGLVVAGVATMFIPGLNVAGAALIGVALGAAGGAAPGVIQGFQTGNWDWGAIGGGALKGAVIGGVTFGAARGLGGGFGGSLLGGSSRLASTMGGTVLGAGSGAVGGTASELYDLTPLPGSDGQFDPEVIVVSTAAGGGTGALGGAISYRPATGAASEPAPASSGGPGTELVRVPDFRDTQAAFRHYGKHVLGTEPLPNGQYRVMPGGPDMPEYSSFSEYRSAARSFMSADYPDGVMQNYRGTDLVRVDPKSGEFGVRSQDGTIRTSFRPDDDPVAYFQSQFQ